MEQNSLKTDLWTSAWRTALRKIRIKSSHAIPLQMLLGWAACIVMSAAKLTSFEHLQPSTNMSMVTFTFTTCFWIMVSTDLAAPVPLVKWSVTSERRIENARSMCKVRARGQTGLQANYKPLNDTHWQKHTYQNITKHRHLHRAFACILPSICSGHGLRHGSFVSIISLATLRKASKSSLGRQQTAPFRYRLLMPEAPNPASTKAGLFPPSSKVRGVKVCNRLKPKWTR